jgi:hypothetical protein
MIDTSLPQPRPGGPGGRGGGRRHTGPARRRDPAPSGAGRRIQTVQIQRETITVRAKDNVFRFTPIRIEAILVFQNLTGSRLIVPLAGIVISRDRIARDLQGLKMTRYGHRFLDFYKGGTFAGKYPEAPDARYAILEPGESVEIPVAVATFEPTTLVVKARNFKLDSFSTGQAIARPLKLVQPVLSKMRPCPPPFELASHPAFRIKQYSLASGRRQAYRTPGVEEV